MLTGGPLGALCDELVAPGHCLVLHKHLPEGGVAAEDGADVADGPDGVAGGELRQELIAHAAHAQPDAHVACARTRLAARSTRGLPMSAPQRSATQSGDGARCETEEKE